MLQGEQSAGTLDGSHGIALRPVARVEGSNFIIGKDYSVAIQVRLHDYCPRDKARLGD
jgi:hypothetical protein